MKKSYKECLQKIDSEVEGNVNDLEKSLGINNSSENLIVEVASVPIKVAGTAFSKLFYLGQNIAKYPLAAVDYFIQK